MLRSRDRIQAVQQRWCGLGRSTRSDGTVRWYARPPQLTAPTPPHLFLAVAGDAAALVAALDALEPSPSAVRLILTCLAGPAERRLQCRAECPGDDGFSDMCVTQVHLPGAGMHRFGPGEDGTFVGRDPRRWRRSIGALGATVWSRFQAAHYVLVSAGRGGSLLAEELAQAGVTRLSLIDPDRLELHNVGEGAGYDHRHLGQNKAEALGRALEDRHGGVRAAAVAASVTSWAALGALKAADLVVCWPDSEAARFVTAAVAAFYAKPILDLGTGIFQAFPLGNAAPRVDRGADVRLTLPGDGCLLCRGGLAGEPADWSDPPPGGPDERAGSLRALNATAVGLGVGLWQDVLLGQRTASAHLRLTWDQDGQVVLHEPTRTRPLGGCLCDWVGLGDEGLLHLRRWMAAPTNRFRNP